MGTMTRRSKVSNLGTAAALAFALLAGAHAGVASAQDVGTGSGDQVVGSGWHIGQPGDGTFPGFHVSVQARSGASGESASGRVSVRTDEGMAYNGHVTCVTAAGNTAGVGFVVDKIISTGRFAPPAEGSEQLLDVLDGGDPGPKGDFVQLYPFDWFPATYCPFWGAAAPATQGNYQVEDAAP
jgi:hypothetical protein